MKRGQIVAGVLLIALGVLFLVGQTLDLGFLAEWWPAFVVVPGLAMLAVSLLSDESAAPLAIPGCIVTTVGVLLAVMNLTGWWQTWAYAWALVAPGSVGAGLAIFGARTDRPELRTIGSRLAMAGVLIAAVLGLFFELIVGLSGPLGPWVAGILWPLVLIALGIWLMLPRKGRRAA